MRLYLRQCVTIAAADMTDEERRSYNREKTRRYRAKHAGDLAFKANLAKVKREWTRANRQAIARQKRERYRNDKAFKAAACANAIKWREANADRWLAAQTAWRAANREKLKQYLRQYHKQRKLTPEAADRREKRTAQKRAYYLANKEKLKEQRLERHARRPELRYAVDASRRAKKKHAMPQWADRAAIAAIYREAKKLMRETGIDWHVDHIVPLKHPLVCGLHVAHNLQLLPGAENVRKNNRFVV